MAILYIDFENGNDNYGGTSFNLLASGTDGRITTATFSAATANFPNDNSLINQYLSIFNGTIYAIYQITAWVSSTSLTIAALSGGTALANQTVDRQYFIGGRWQTLTNGATAVRIIPGDEIRVMASPDPTSLGINGTWTSSPLQPTRSISSSTNATPIVVTCNAHGYSNGDTIVITGHNTNTNANGTWEISNVTTNTFTLVNSIGNGIGGATGTARLRNNSVVKLASPVTANIASTGNRGNGRTAWTQSTNVVASLNTTDYKEGDVSDSIAINATFTTGLAAYKATGTLNLSGYQQVSFWIKQTAGTVTIAGDVSLRLCSDTAGANTVHTIPIPALGALNVWNPITVDLGVNLDSNIQSIALYVDTDRGAVTFLLSNIIACKNRSSNDSLSLISLIGKNTGTEPWIAIQSINGTRVFLDGLVSHLPTTTTLMGYNRVSETVTTYKRETIPILVTQSLNENGIDTNRFSLSGGWDTTDMSTQNSDTYLDGRRGSAVILSANFIRYWNISKLNFFRGLHGIDLNSSTNCNILNIKDCNNNNTTSFSLYGCSNVLVSGIDNLCFNNVGIASSNNASSNIITNIKNIDSNSSTGIGFVTLAGSRYNDIDNIITLNNNGGSAIDLSSWFQCTMNNINFIDNNSTRGISIVNCSDLLISNIGSISGTSSTITANTYTNPILLSSSDNCQLINITGVIGATASAISCISSFNNSFFNVNTSGSTTSAFAGDIGSSYCRNCTFGESSLVTGLTSNREGRVYLTNQNNNSNNNQIHMFGGNIVSTTGVRYGSSGYSWALSPTNSSRNSFYPVSFSLAKVYVVANKLVTVRAMMSRTDIGLTVRLRVPGNQIAGVPNDIISGMVQSALPWEQVSLTFTPTANGAVEILGEAFGGTTFTGYIDNVVISQES